MAADDSPTMAFENAARRDAPPVSAPSLYRVVSRRRETRDVTTLTLVAHEGDPLRFRCGQFNMLTAFGVGEAAISLSGLPGDGHVIQHTVRDVGAVSHALCHAPVGGTVGVRGPFGSDWGVDALVGPTAPDERAPQRARAADVVVVAGGIGLAPLRGAIEALVRAAPAHRKRVFVLVGARDPSQLIFREDLESWARRGARVEITVDSAAPGWPGHVGLVTSLLAQAGFDPARADVLICGPEIMMRFTARAVIDLGVDPTRVRVSLERNMQCGVGWCGHCQLGPLLLCRDGPVLPYGGLVAKLLSERER